MGYGGSKRTLGATLTENVVHFRVWAPSANHVSVVTVQPHNTETRLELTESGYFEGNLPCNFDRIRYFYRLDTHEAFLPDPCSRFQPLGPTGPSEVVDLESFPWRDEAWRGVERQGHVIYEMHIGTFTQAGTWRAAKAELAELKTLGITLLQIMPLVESYGEFGWSYDCVNYFAPSHNYGTPQELMEFIDEARRLGLGVILDVVYNHFSSLAQKLLKPFSASYFSTCHQSEWGPTTNFDNIECGPIRDFFLQNSAYWISHYHLDGLRVDATQEFHDDSDHHILRDLTRVAREAAGGRRIFLLAESEPQQAGLLRDLEAGGFGFDAAGNDDFHHSARVCLTGCREAYYADYQGSASELLAAIKWGYLFQGQHYRWQGKSRGTPALDLPLAAFTNYLQNHDQIANSKSGRRLQFCTSPRRYRAMTALLLLAPQTPFLFQGQEFAASSPFTYFNDCEPELAESIHEARTKFLSQFQSLADPEAQRQIPHPKSREQFNRCKLNFAERTLHAEAYALHKDLLTLRREKSPFQGEQRLDGAALSKHAFFLRSFADSNASLAIFNFGQDLHCASISQPLVAPPCNCSWNLIWSSEDVRYGGGGISRWQSEDGWHFPAESALLLQAVPKETL